MPYRWAVILLMLASCRGAAGSSTEMNSRPDLTQSTRKLNCDGMIGTRDELPQGVEDVGNAVALPTRKALGTARTNDADPAHRLRAKQGLYLRTRATADLIVSESAAGHLAFQWSSPEPTGHLQVGPCESSRKWIAFPGGYVVSEVGCFTIFVRDSNGDHEAKLGVGAPCPGQDAVEGYSES